MSTTDVGSPEVDLDVLEVVDELHLRASARRSLLDFAKEIDSNYVAFPVHQYIAERLEAVERGESRRLAIFIGPSTGKSRLASELFPAWVLGRNPHFEVIAASYNADKAQEFGSVARNLLLEPRYQQIFPGVVLAKDSQARDYWKTSKGGTYKAEGVDGGLVGFHAHIAIIDDPVKDMQEALSPRRREQIKTWYATVLLNRLRSFKEGPGAVVLIMQRWHDDDLGGYVLSLKELEEEDWEVIMLPSFAEEDDPLGRKPGEVLLPAGPNQRTRAELEQLRKRDPDKFLALHQQKPIADKGDIFEKGWISYYRELPNNLTFYAASDYAVSENSGDYTVHLIAGVSDSGSIYLADLWRGRESSKIWVDHLLRLAKQWEVFVAAEERGQIISGVGPFLVEEMRRSGVYFIRRGFVSSKNKVVRTGSIAAMFQAGRVFLPMEAAWTAELVYELIRFPKHQHDDQVDALSLLGRMIGSMRNYQKPRDESEKVATGTTFNNLLQNRVRRAKGLPIRETSPVYVNGKTFEQGMGGEEWGIG